MTIKQFFSITSLLLLPPLSHAQSMTVMSAGADAQNCSQAAIVVSRNIPTLRAGIETCTRALEYGQLNRRDRAATLVNRGIVLTSDGKYPDALADYNEALSLLPDLPEPFVGRGNLMFLAGRYDLAIVEYDKALSMQLEKRHLGLYNRGLAYVRQSMPSAAEADFREALALAPEWQLPKDQLAKLATPAPTNNN
jgi:tetratricopeptide (TPR) repeat protein